LRTPTQEYTDKYAAIKIPEYRHLITGRFFFIIGLRMLGTLMGWWVYSLSGAALAIGLIGLSEVIPAVSLALYAGHVIDISEKRKLLLSGATGYITCVLLLLGLAYLHHISFISNNITISIIYIIVFFTGIIRAFTGPVFHTIYPSIVPKSIMQNATTWNQGSWLLASVLGHAIGGFLIAQLDIIGTLVCIAILVLIGISFMVKIAPKPAYKGNTEKKTFESVKEGIRFVVKTKEVFGALMLDLFAVLFGGAVAIIPIFAKDILQVGATGFGWLNAATDMGAIIVIILLTFYPLQSKQGVKLLLSIAGFGVCIIVFAISKMFWLSFAALLVSGILDGVSVVVRGTIVQLKTPDAMRGRVMSVNSMFINSSNELGQFESGIAAKLLGVVPSVIFGGCMTIAVVITTWFKAPTLRKMEY